MAGGYTETVVLTGLVSDTETDSIRDLVNRIVQVVGGENDPEARKIAFDALREFVDDVNIRHHFDFLTEVFPDFDLSENVSSYVMPADFYGMRLVQLIKSDDPNEGIEAVVNFADWETSAQYWQNKKLTGRPKEWSIRKPYDSSAVLDIFPIPDAQVATDYDIRVSYYKRLDQITDSPTVRIGAPRELTRAALAFGRMMILSIRTPGNPEIDRHERHYESSIQKFFDIRETAVRKQLRMKLAASGRFAGRRARGGRR